MKDRVPVYKLAAKTFAKRRNKAEGERNKRKAGRYEALFSSAGEADAYRRDGEQQRKDASRMPRDPTDTGDEVAYANALNPADIPTYVPPPASSYVPITDEVFENWLIAFADTTSFATACVKCNVGYAAMKTRVADNPDWEERVNRCKELFGDRTEAIMYDRAVNGWIEPVFGKDGLVGYVRKRDHKLLEAVNKANNPKYKDKLDIGVAAPGTGVLVVPIYPPGVDWRKDVAEAGAKLRAAVEADRDNLGVPKQT